MRIAGTLWIAMTTGAALAAGAPDSSGGPAAAPTAIDPAGAQFFEKQIRPLLVQKCYECHSSAKKIKGGLQLDHRQGWVTGGDSGPAIVPGDIAASRLIKAIDYHDPDLQMPPKGKLPDAQVQLLKQWVKMGAPDPRLEIPAGAKAHAAANAPANAADHWAFQPMKATAPPSVQKAGWPRDDIDRFILAKLEAAKLAPAADADRSSLLRRVTFDLIGLPPKPADIDAFTADPAPTPAALAKAVDRLLATPQYGERWGRHWLDVARFAESSGGGRSLAFKDAWRYRDYVIDAFNADLPYDRFLAEQIAGDLLPASDDEQRKRRLTATAYLILGAHNYEEQDKLQLEFDVIDEQLETIGKGLMGMTLGCARCHDHKFDPITQRDYYALAGIFYSTSKLKHANVSRWTELELPIDPALLQSIAKHDADLAELKKKIDQAKRKMDAAKVAVAPGDVVPIPLSELSGLVIDDAQARQVGAWTRSVSYKRYIADGYLTDKKADKGGLTLTFQPEFKKAGYYEVRLAYIPGVGRDKAVPYEILTAEGEINGTVDMSVDPPVEGRFVSLGRHRFDATNQWYVMISNKDTTGYVCVDAVQFLPADEPVAAAEAKPGQAPTQDARMLVELRQMEKQVKVLEKEKPIRPTTMGVGDADKPENCRVCIRGLVHNQGELVPRGFLPAATKFKAPAIPENESGRRQLAQWLTDPANPLVARNYVNRVWHHLLGAGLVRTTDNFGTTGESPSHPELLDHLALSFIADGFSTRKLIRRIVLSRAYAMSTVADPRCASLDPDNRLLSHANRRRLDAESLRDAILTVSRQLDLTVGGPLVTDPTLTNTAGDKPTEYDYLFTDSRRSVYTPAFRNRMLEIFEVFDFADPNSVVGKRNTSTVAPQALFMLNSPFIMQQAKFAAQCSLDQQDQSDSRRLESAFRAALGRAPTDAEKTIALQALNVPNVDRLQAWARFYQALFACIDFRYLN